MRMALVIVVAAACNAGAQAPRESEHAVYAAVISGQLRDSPDRIYVVLDSTADAGFGEFDESTIEFLRSELAKRQPPIELDPALANSYRQANTVAAHVDGELLPTTLTIVVGRETIDSVFRGGSWEAFYDRFPRAAGYVR